MNKIFRRLVNYIKYLRKDGYLYILDDYIDIVKLWLRMRYRRSVCGAMGKNVIFDEGVVIKNPRNLFIGNNSGMNHSVWINANGGVRIGDNVIIGPMTIIHSMNHRFDRLDIPIREQGWVKKPVMIEDDVWIAAACIILAGVRIGKGSVISAGAVVTHDIPPYSVAMGVPATVRSSRIRDEVITPPMVA